MQNQIRFFYIPYVLIFIFSIILWMTLNHGDVVLWMNELQTPFLNGFFKVWTHGGDGILFGAVVLILLLLKRRYGIVLIIIGVAQGLISAFMKQILFKGTPRPKKYFEDQEVLNLIEGVRIHDFNSFPSGHTMTAFALATFISFLTDRKDLKLALLLFAVLVGASRIYLNQHFFIDVIVGSAIGVAISTVCFKLAQNYLKGSKV